MAKRKKTNGAVCTVCEDNPQDYPNAGLCKPCYAALYYWKSKTVKAIVRRQHNLEVYQRRMDVIAGTRGSNR